MKLKFTEQTSGIIKEQSQKNPVKEELSRKGAEEICLSMYMGNSKINPCYLQSKVLEWMEHDMFCYKSVLYVHR